MHLSRASRAVGLAVVLACAGAAASHSPKSGPRLHRLGIRELMFRPHELQVATGDTIRWANQDIVPHTVTADDAGWDSGEIPPGGEFTLVVEGHDAIPYVCRYHATMTATLLVR